MQMNQLLGCFLTDVSRTLADTGQREKFKKSAHFFICPNYGSNCPCFQDKSIQCEEECILSNKFEELSAMPLTSSMAKPESSENISDEDPIQVADAMLNHLYNVAESVGEMEVKSLLRSCLQMLIDSQFEDEQPKSSSVGIQAGMSWHPVKLQLVSRGQMSCNSARSNGMFYGHPVILNEDGFRLIPTRIIDTSYMCQDPRLFNSFTNWRNSSMLMID